jgi:hypothetical protein
MMKKALNLMFGAFIFNCLKLKSNKKLACKLKQCGNISI